MVGGAMMCLIERAATAGILRRAVDITLDTAERTTHQMRSMQGQMHAGGRDEAQEYSGTKPKPEEIEG